MAKCIITEVIWLWKDLYCKLLEVKRVWVEKCYILLHHSFSLH